MKTNETTGERPMNILPGHGPWKTMKAIFQELADGLDGSEELDSYGSGPYLTGFEAEMARLFGKEAAAFMPSGIMAQQAALRAWCEQSRNFTVAMHPTAHLEFAEHAAYQFLHPLKRLQFGAPEFLRDRLLKAADFEALGSRPGAILLELPCRPLGGELPTWDELLAIRDWARLRAIPLHMDGARIWSCRPFYQKEYAEIAEVFDSIYVSFYKDLGGLCGSILMGPADFIQEAKIWQTRHGGRLVTMGPYVVSARLNSQRVLPQIDQWITRAQEVAVELSKFERVAIRPNPPQVNFFQLYIQGDADALNARHAELSKETGTFLFFHLSPTMVPGVAMAEIHCWENSLQFDLKALPDFMRRLLE